MKLFELTEDLLTGNKDIDEHHRALLKLGNLVVQPSAIKAEGTIFAEAISFLSNYVMYHFAAEEYAMVSSNYPNYEHHRQWHEHFKHEVSIYVNQAQAEGASKDLKLKVSFAIENWLLEHIRITDRSLAKYLQEQGIDTNIYLPTIRTLKDKGKLPEAFDELSVWSKID
ncbi:MAG: hemerythrin domain-containing protein [Syntrophales bacterium]|jgi:hemerythrin|nr:hemerythrin domain-containing protein [Syntrophales bacterium]MCK9391915.1 hemerythrin domain-containing protein [Syntrophales bacterium]